MLEKSQTTIQKISKTTADMAELTFSSTVQWSPLLQFLLVSSGILISFITAYYSGNVNLYLPFISETGAFSPEKCIFSLTLIIGSFIGGIFILFRYLIIAHHPLNDERIFLKMNQGSLIIGISSMIGLAAVAAFPMTTVFWAHLLAAALYFMGSAAYMILSTAVTYKINGQCKMFFFRLILSISITVFQLILVIVFPIALKNWYDEHDIMAALKTPDDKGFTLLFISSLLEWTIVAQIVCFHLSFIFELRKFKLSMKAEEINRNSTDADPLQASEVPNPL